MKTLSKLLLITLAVFLAGGKVYSQKTNKLYKAKSGIIEYKLTGNTEGSETLFFDDHGKKEATYRDAKTKIMGMTTEESTISIRVDSVHHNIDMIEKTGVRTVIPFDPSELTGEQIKEMEAMGESMMDEMGFKKAGKENILGRSCDVWENETLQTKIWIWENLTMRTEVNMMGQFITEAVNIDVNARIPTGKFEVPSGIEIFEGEPGDFDYEEGEYDSGGADALDSVASELGKELEKGLNELKGILGGKKKKKK